MKREIKFRGLKIASKNFVFGSYVNKSNKDQIVTSNNVFPIDVIANTIGQFTGLKDKNGKDIYEGDIIQCETFFGGSTIFGTVIFSEKGMWLAKEIHHKYSETDYLFEVAKRSIIIGNIHENPELLNA